MCDLAPPPVRLTLLRHPFRREREVALEPFTGRISLEALAQKHGMAEGHVLALVGDAAVPRWMWPHIAPKPGVEIILRRVPEDSGRGKNPLSTILSIAGFFVPLAWGPELLAADAIFAGSPAIGLYGALTRGALFVASMALSRAPSQRMGSSSALARDPTSYLVTGASNKVTPYGVVPRLYGRKRIYPPFAAQPYTETVGGKQYLNLLFDFGYGPLKFEDFRIGGTPLAHYAGVEMDIRAGWPDDTPIGLYRDDVSPQQLSILVRAADGPRIIETALDTDEATLGLVFAQGLVAYDDEEGDKIFRTVRIKLDWRAAGSSDAWSSVGVQGGAVVGSTAATEIATSPDSRTFRTDLPTTGKIDLKLNLDPADSWSISTRDAGAATWVQQAVQLDGYWSTNPETGGATWVQTLGPQVVNLVVTPGVQTEILVQQTPWTPDAKGTPPPPDKQPTVLEVGYSYVDNGYYDFTANQASAYLTEARVRFPARGKYEVRLTRISGDSSADTVRDELTWAVLNSIAYRPPVTVSGHALVALRIKASEQLNGVVQEFSAIATALIKTWNGTAWSDFEESRNPAWVYADILCGAANARPIDRARLDVAALAVWASDCDAAGLQFIGVFDFRTTVFEAARDVASVGRASFHMRDGLYSVAQDKRQTAPAQHFTPRNSWGYSASRRFIDLPHALKVRFFNRDRDWQQDERIVPDDGYTEESATRFEVMEMFGVDQADQAWKMGRFHIANARLRPEEHTFYADVEHIVCNRGDMIRLTHDVILVGLGFGRLKSVTLDGALAATAAALDAEIVMESDKAYSLRLRLADGRSVLAGIDTVAGGQTAVTFPVPIAAADAPEAGDLFMFGETGAESGEYLVTAIEPRADLSAQIRCVDHAPAVYAADSEAIPPWESHISLPAVWMRRPPTPVFEAIASDESVLVLTQGGDYQPVIQATLSIPSGGVVQPVGLEVRWRRQGASSWRSMALAPVSPQVATLGEIEHGATYELAARTVGGAGESSAFAETTHLAIGAATPPPAVTALLMRNDALMWSHDQPRDHAGYRVRYLQAATAEWGEAAPAHLGLVTAAPFDVSAITGIGGTVTFLVKAVDLAGNESATAATLTASLGDAVTANVIVSEAFHPAFDGTIEHGAVNAGVLQADATASLFWGASSAVFWGAAGDDFWDTTYEQMIYSCVLTIGATESGAGRVLLAHTIAGAYTIEYKLAGASTLFWGASGDAFWGASGDLFWDVPGDWQTWPGFLDPIPTGGIYFRITVAGGTPRGEIAALTAILDVPDVVEVLDDVSISSAGTTRLPITASFRAITAVNLTLQDIATGARSAVCFDKDEVNGPLVKAYDSGGTLVNASVDAIVQGY